MGYGGDDEYDSEHEELLWLNGKRCKAAATFSTTIVTFGDVNWQSIDERIIMYYLCLSSVYENCMLFIYQKNYNK